MPAPRTGLVAATVSELRHLVGTRARRVLLAVTLALGVVAAVGVLVGTGSDQRTLAVLADPVQSLMSVTVPFLGVLAVAARRGNPLLPQWLAATVLALAVGAFGVAVCLVALAVAPSTASEGRWADGGGVVLGSLLVQVVSMLCGTGFGLLIRSRALAMVLDVVLPLGLWLAAGAARLTGLQAWLTPYASARRLLSGQMHPVDWAHLAVVVAIWVVGLNLAGALSRGGGSPPPRPARPA